MKNLLFILVPLLLFGSCGTPESATETPVETTKPTSKTTGTDNRQRILFFGDSLTAGYGLSDDEKGYVDLVQEQIDATGLPFVAVQAGVSGETSAGGKTRIDWVNQQDIDVFVLELGANDGLRGIDPESTFENLKAILFAVKDDHPNAVLVLAGMEAPPNMGADYTQQFRSIFPRLAAETGALLIPFFLKNVAGEPTLNQADGIHPNQKGQYLLRDNVWEVLSPVLPKLTTQ